MVDQIPIGQLIARARQRLAPVSDTPSLDAQLLMMKVLGQPRAWLLAHPEYKPNPEQQIRYRDYVNRCAQGEALPYVLGWWEFFGRQFHLSPDVLIPRPETERLVELALSSMAAQPEPIRVLDLGTGSGCILVSLALEMPNHNYYGSDISAAALAVAKKNLQEYRLENEVVLVQADLLGPFAGPFGLIVANLPYIPHGRLGQLRVAKREPELALSGGQDGLAVVGRTVQQLVRVLDHNAEVLLELDPDQMRPARDLLGEACDWRAIEVHHDLAGRARFLHATGASGLRIIHD